MRTLIYKRTHHGDPDESGVFGIHDCMGRVRSWNFEAVIGVGGARPDTGSEDIAFKVNWIGIGPRKRVVPDKRGPLVTFEHFKFFGGKGPSFELLAPVLSRRIFSRNVRVAMNGLSDVERDEVAGILAQARNAPPSSERSVVRRATKRC